MSHLHGLRLKTCPWSLGERKTKKTHLRERGGKTQTLVTNGGVGAGRESEGQAVRERESIIYFSICILLRVLLKVCWSKVDNVENYVLMTVPLNFF